MIQTITWHKITTVKLEIGHMREFVSLLGE